MRATLIGAGLLSVIALAGCSATPAPVTAHGDAPVVSPSTDDSIPDVLPDDSTSVTEDAPTARVGDTVQIGDWSVRVTKVSLNADRAIHSANMFNDRPKRGTHFVMVTFTARYDGAERKSDVLYDLTWTLTQKDNKVLDEASEVTPMDEASAPTTARRHGTVTHQVVFDAASVALVSVEDYDNYADFEVTR